MYVKTYMTIYQNNENTCKLSQFAITSTTHYVNMLTTRVCLPYNHPSRDINSVVL